MLLSCHVWVSEWVHTIVCLNVKELLAGSKHHIWSLSDGMEFEPTFSQTVLFAK